MSSFVKINIALAKLKHTRKCPLRGHCLAPPGRRQRITLKKEKNFGSGGIMGYGGRRTGYGQIDVEFEIGF